MARDEKTDLERTLLVNESFGVLFRLVEACTMKATKRFAGNDLHPVGHPLSTSLPIAVLLLVKGIIMSSGAANI